MAIGLNDYTFQLDTTGVTLNTDATVPFVDVDKISGLDNAPYRETVRDHEGTDGGFMDAEFEKGRDVIIDGIIYTDGADVETYLDSLKANYAPVQTPIPLYIKAPGVSERLIFVKPRGVRYDWTTLRRLGITSAQFLMFAEDPRIYDAVLSTLLVNYGGDVGNGFEFLNSFYDQFSRVTASAWGTPNTPAVAYTDTGGAASDFFTNGSVGGHTLTSVNVTRSSTETGFSNSDVALKLIDLNTSVLAVGANINHFIDIRYVDSNNHYRLTISRQPGDIIQFNTQRILAGVGTTISSNTTVPGVTATTSINLIFECTTIAGVTTIQAKGWSSAVTEPTTWLISGTDSGLTGVGGVRFSNFLSVSNTNTLPVTNTISQMHIPKGFGFNLDFGGGATPGGGSVTNIGNRPTPVTYVITGPIINPVVTNITTGQTMTFDITLAALETLTVNTRDRTVYLNGNSNRRNALISPNWFFLNPGVNFISFGGFTGVGSTISISFRSAWR